MAGYLHDYSMSRNAAEAYQSGEMPMSKWTKAAIIEEIRNSYPDMVNLIKSVPAAILRRELLEKSSWHHTSCRFNRTDFYAISEAVMEDLTAEQVAAWAPIAKAEPKTVCYRGDLHYIEWSGTRKHPKATAMVLEDIDIEERGSFYICFRNGEEVLRKKIGGNGTHAVSYEARRLAKEAEAKRIAERNEAIKSRSDAETYGLYIGWSTGDGIDTSSSGNIYRKGRKPGRLDYAIGLASYLTVGEQRIAYDPERDRYHIQTWNGAAYDD